MFTKDTHYLDYLDTLEGKMLPIPHCIENTKGWSINKQIEAEDAKKATKIDDDDIANAKRIQEKN